MMTHLFLSLPLLLGMLLPLRAQVLNENREYYDFNWKLCDKNVSSFHRVVTSQSDTAWLIADYYRFAGLQMSGLARRSDGSGKIGTWTWYHPSGQRSRVKIYINDTVQGVSNAWYANGQLSDSTFYRGGKPDGTSLEWYANGQHFDSTFYRDGKADGTSLKWHDNGQRSDSTFYRDGKIDGRVLTWNANGQLRSQGSYDQGQPVGIHRKWYENGTLEAESKDRSRGVPSTWTWYDSTGRMTAIETYDNGRIINPVYYEPDGTTHSDTARAESYGHDTMSGTAFNNLARAITYPKLERNNSIEGTVLLQFQVREDGSVGNIEIKVPATPGMNAEALRAIQAPGLFTPPRFHNKPWSFTMMLPISFRLE